MPIPRFREPRTGAAYEIVLWCPTCAYSVLRDRLTESWSNCPCPVPVEEGQEARRCGAPLETKKILYGVVRA